MRRSRSGLKTWVLVTFLLALFLVGSISYLGWRQSVPRVSAELDSPPRFIGLQTPLSLELTAQRGGVAWVQLRLVQGAREAVVFQQEFPSPRANRQRVELTIEGHALGLREGGARLEVLARDHFWRPLQFDDRPVVSRPVTLDLTPPVVRLLYATRYLAQGGSGVVAFRAKNDELGTVHVDELAFPSFPVGDPEDGTRVAFIAIPYKAPPTTPLRLILADRAGNQASRTLASVITRRRFTRTTVHIRQAFLRRKLPELLPERGTIPDNELLAAFLEVNRDKRRQAEEAKRVIAAKTQPKALWRGAFLHPRNAKVSSNFAETRTYRFRGKKVDTQVHFGYDLASVRESPVLAANAGVVMFAQPLNIYGLTVVLDHGLGLQTLYAHLSRIAVAVGDQVEKGQVLGSSGSTGLAAGDHLHYEVLIHGISVTPLEWWDPKWIQQHIISPLQAANVALLEE
ncbi:MAG: M23 family metallopeptidase [Candidatus Methylomirabilia bacterium]